MKKNLKTVFPFGLLCASLVFFWNPNIQVVDILPDLFGYILLISALYYLGDLNAAIGEGRERLRKMLIVEVAKGVTFLLIFGGIVTPQEKGTFTLLATLVFCVIELIVLVPAVRSIFVGMMQLATKFGSTAIFATRPKKLPREPKRGFRNDDQKKRFAQRVKKIEYRNRRLRCALEKLQTVTMIFVFAKPIMALLPEFSALSSSEYNESLVDYYNFITLFRGFAVLFFLPLALYWVYRTVKFLRALKRDTAFLEACLTSYRTEILPRTDLFTQRAVKLALSVLGIGIFFSLDFYLDYYNILPDILCAVFVLVGVCMLRKYVTCWKPAAAVAVLYGLVSAVASGLTIRFNTAFYFNAIYKDAAAATTYYGACAATLLENVLFLVLLVMLVRVMEQMIVRYSGFAIGDPAASAKVSRVHSELKKTLYVYLLGGVATAATGVMYEFFKPSVPYIWMIDFAVCVVFIYLFYRSVWEIREQVEYKYMLS